MNQLSNPIGPGRVYTHHRSPWGQYTVVSIPGEGASADSGRLTRVSSGANSPFQKQIRLHEARARLLAEPGDVAGVGFAVGYDNPSQFSREYRRTFGISPAATRSLEEPPLPAAALEPVAKRPLARLRWWCRFLGDSCLHWKFGRR